MNKKIQRFDAALTDPFDPKSKHALVENQSGDWVKFEDYQHLQAQLTEANKRAEEAEHRQQMTVEIAESGERLLAEAQAEYDEDCPYCRPRQRYIRQILDERQTLETGLRNQLSELKAQAEASAIYHEGTDAMIQELKAQLKWREYPAEKPDDNRTVMVRAKWDSGKTYVFSGYYCRQYEIESSYDDECAQDYHEESDTYYIAEGWYENQFNWGGDWSSIAVVEGKVIEWLPIPTTDTKEDLAGN